MPRAPRIAFPGAVYHATGRGNDQRPIVRGDDDRRDFLQTLARVIRIFGWQCYAYCLMNNHYHVVVETPRPNISAGMQRLNGGYAQRFNQRYKRSGHLFQGRFHAHLVDREAYLLEACRYVVLNPVRAGLVQHAGAWLWSSYRATAGYAVRPPFLALSFVHELFSRDSSRAIAAYRSFVADGS